MTYQQLQIIVHMRNAGGISQRDAILDYSISCLTKRISELRAMGYDIASVKCNHPVTGQRYTRYTLVQEHTDAA
jgi:hypothetical protein